MLRELVEKIEGSEVLDPWGERLGAVIGPIVGRGRRRDLLTGRWLGHPAHPMMVIVPMACWIGSAVADVVGPAGSMVARRLLGTGVLTALPAAAAGSADWLDTSRAEQRVGTAHAIANNVALAAFAASWVARTRQGTKLGSVLSGVGLGALGVAGYLGGHLAYSRGVGVNTTAFQSGPEEWSTLCPISDLGDANVSSARIGGLQFVVVRRDGRFDVLEDRCTHRGGPLSEGPADADCIECPWHGSRFSTSDGAVRTGPASVPQPAYESRVRDERLEIRRVELGGLRTEPVGAHHDAE